MAVQKGVAHSHPPSALEELPELLAGKAASFLPQLYPTVTPPECCGTSGRVWHSHAPIARLAERRYPAAPRNGFGDQDYAATRLASRRTSCLMVGRTCT